MNRLLQYFWRGCLVLAPVIVTLYIGWLLITTLDRLLPVGVPGLGLIITVSLVTLVGFLTSNVIGKAIVRFVEQLLYRVPLLKLLYSSIRDLVGAFVGDERRFTKPVSVALDAEGKLHALGFVTRDGLEFLTLPGHVAVYFPQSYNFAGNLMVVASDRVQALDADSADVMAFVVSGGVSGFGAGPESIPPQMRRMGPRGTLIGPPPQDDS